MSILTCRNLNVSFRSRDVEIEVVHDFAFSIEKGECIGIVGESGSGKSQSALAIMGLLADNGKAAGSVLLQGKEILNAPRHALNRIRGNLISMIFQDPMAVLTPHMCIGAQMSEGLVHHRGLSVRAARARVLEVMEEMGISDANRRYSQYPHELSGGMRQRIMIAQAILCKPVLVIADEPTTALDVTVQAHILQLLSALKRHTDTALIMISHDLGVIAGLCDRVIVMYSGSIVETATVDDIFYRPRHPYTQGLLASIPSLDMDPSEDLRTIRGQPPGSSILGPGCPFADRCDFVFERCKSEKPALRRRPHREYSVACHLDDRE